MKKLLFIALLMLSVSVYSQAPVVVNYQNSDINIANPERGMYKHEETHSGNYELLSQSSMTTLRTNSKITLVLRLFLMEDFVNSNISSSYLANMQTDFNAARGAGVKLIVRFAYNDDNENGLPWDANKARILSHIQQLAPVLNANQDVIDCFQAGFIGVWGEWYYTDHFGVGNLTAQNIADRNEVLSAMMQYFPISRQIQLRTPDFMQNMYGQNPTTSTQAYQTGIGRLSLHNDAFLAGDDDEGTYNQINADRAYAKEVGKYGVIGGETNTPNTSYTPCAKAMENLRDFSYSYLNSGYHPTVIAGWSSGTNPCIETIKKALGYRFELLSTTVTQSQVTVVLRNVGYGHLHNARVAYLVYRNTATGAETSVAVNSDPRFWLKGSDITLTNFVPSLPNATYHLFLNLPDPMLTNVNYSIQCANTGTWEAVKGYNDLKTEITVSSLGTTPITPPSTVIKIFLNSENKVIVTNLDGYTIKIYDMAGRLVVKGNDLSNKPNGVYIVKVVKGSQKYTQKVVKR